MPRVVRAKAIHADSRVDLALVPVSSSRLDSAAISEWFVKGYTFPPALMCLEIDPRDCHRHRIARALERKGFRSYDL